MWRDGRLTGIVERSEAHLGPGPLDLVCSLEGIRESARMLTAFHKQGRTDSPR